MYLNCETILDFYTHKNKKILCQIKVSPSKSRKFKNTCRCLTQEQWSIFDNELEHLMTTTDNWDDEKCLKFKIKSYIEVKVQKSKLSLKHFYKSLGAINDGEDKKDAGSLEGVVEAEFVIECLLDFQKEHEEYKPNLQKTDEYDPLSSPDGKLSSSLSYEPYTPSKKKYRADNIDTVKTPGIELLDYNEDTYSPKPLAEISESQPTLTEIIPKYTPAPIKTTRDSRESCTSIHYDLSDEVIVETEDEIGSPEKGKSSKSILNKKPKKRESEYVPKSQEFTVIDIPIYIPTPIESSFRKRSKTIDEFPARNKNPKERSKTIDEIPPELALSIEKRFKHTTKEQKYKTPSHKSLEKINEKDEKTRKTKEKSTHSEKKPTKSAPSSGSEDEFLEALEKSKKATKVQTKENEDELKDLDKNKKTSTSDPKVSNSKVEISSATETDTSPKISGRGRKSKKSPEVLTSLRRSERSPSKPIRLIEEHNSHTRRNKSKKSKTSPKNKELFGTDDDDDDFENNNNNSLKTSNDSKSKSPVFETPISKKTNKSASSSSSSSAKKKRKRDKSSECEQEKRDMGKWLSKKKSSSSSEKEATKTSRHGSKSSTSSKYPALKTSSKENPRKAENARESRPKSPSPTPVFELPSKEELESIRNKTKLTQQKNAKVKAELDKLRTSPPKEVAFLSLQNIPPDDILNTFLTHKAALDEIYENKRKMDYIKGHDGINHCFVIRLLQPTVQMKMLDKLTDEYSHTSSAQATLFANALLPEWVMRVYMEKFNFTRQQAINHIKAQEEFQLHMEEQSDSSFMFD